MRYGPITDWDDAYANGIHIPDADSFPLSWTEQAQAFRDRLADVSRAKLDQTYGTDPRKVYDLFLPEGQSKGLFVFVHGGYWKAFDNKSWSHLASGLLQQGWTCAVPTYPLCPHVGIAHITRSIAKAIHLLADRIDGPLLLAGHSAGGHLVTRMMCREGPLAPNIQNRIRAILSISGVHDLRPLLRTQMNTIFNLSLETAAEESPALLHPIDSARLLCLVGADERPEFVRQNDLLANIWAGLGVETTSMHASGVHHFNVIDALTDPQSAPIQWLLQAADATGTPS
ncbi:alpha/beta hydrolase [Coralliovum pocilloporae]|uniref:alpha/beta hydrolase n=1 Tax=Coralliovum pocilloporae TaxID=3066369 RepID=UPI00330798D0